MGSCGCYSHSTSPEREGGREGGRDIMTLQFIVTVVPDLASTRYRQHQLTVMAGSA